jgi:chemotaxis signal transduction protein
VSTAAAGSTITQLLFRLGGYTFALPADSVRVIEDWRDPQPIPHAAANVLGWLTAPDGIALAVDLAPLFDLPSSEPRYLMLLEQSALNQQKNGAFIPADQIVGVRHLPSSSFGHRSIVPQFAQSPYVRAVGIDGDQVFQVLSPVALLHTVHPIETEES